MQATATSDTSSYSTSRTGRSTSATSNANPSLSDLTARTFKTKEFYARHQDDLVPSGMAFFQSDYDSGVREVGYK